MKKQLLILITLCITTIGYSQTFLDANFIEYTVIPSTNTVEVTDYDFPNGGVAVNIPATVVYNSTTYTVTEIGDEAFLAYGSSEKITSVVIPNGVTFIGYRAFQGNLLTSVTIPDSVTQLSNLSFGENPLLASVILSNSLTEVPLHSFVSCALTSITIPSGVTSIGNLAFANNQLTSVTIPSAVSSIGIQGFKGNPLTCVITENIIPPTIVTPTGPNTSTDTFSSRGNIHLTIPAGTLGDYATNTGALWTGFNSVAEGLSGTFVVDNITYYVTSVPNSEVKTLDYNTAGGTVVNIPASVTRNCTDYSVTAIGNNAFNGNNLTSVTIPDSVINIGQGAFNINNITNLVLGNNVETIGNWSFRFNNLATLTIPDSVTSIASYAFGNNDMTNLVIGNSVETIGIYAFVDNDIASLNIPDSVLTIGDYAFAYNDGMTNLVIGNSVTTIGEFAFEMNTSAQLTSVTIPSSVTTIGDYAFNIASLTDVTSLATTPPTISTGTNDTFGSTANRNAINLHIPAGTMGAYVTNAGALWTDFMLVTEDALSVTDFEIENTVKIITTPNALKVVTSNGVNLQNYTIYNISGAKVNSGTQSEIATTNFSKGIYILKLDFNNGTMVTKVIVK